MLASNYRKWSRLISTLVIALNPFKGVITGDCPLPTVSKDVVIVGGGAGGTYAAIRLREDYGRSILLVEMEAVLVNIPSYILKGVHN